MDGRIPPDRPRRSASEPLARTAPATTPLQAPGESPTEESWSVVRARSVDRSLDTMQQVPLPGMRQASLSTPILAAPRYTSAQAHANLTQAGQTSGGAVALAILRELEADDAEGAGDESDASSDTYDVNLTPDLEQQVMTNFFEAASLRGATAGTGVDDLFANYGHMLFEIIEQVLNVQQEWTSTPQMDAVQAALGDVGAWYQSLDPQKTQRLHVSRQDDYTCAISQKSFHELEHPVAVRRGSVVRVFEAEDILRWMHMSMQEKSHYGRATHPVDRSDLRLSQIARAENALFGPLGPART